MKKFVHDFIVISNKRLNSNHFVLELLSPEPLSTMEPGQFAEVLINGSQDVFLRRPFSIHNADRQKNTISLFIKIVGKGTHALSIVQKGEKLNLIYPLGKGFRLPAHEKILVVGGGCGIAPLLFLVHTLHDRGVKSDIILGARSAGDLLITQQFSRYGNMFLMTEDGSAGEKGLVTQHSMFSKGSFAYQTIFGCGPTPMLKALDKIATAFGIECQVSLENTMACGIGACLCCVVKTTTGNRCVCTEGPVFDTRELDGWYQPIAKCYR